MGERMLETRVATIGKVCFGFAGLLGGDPKGAASLAEVAAGTIDRARTAVREPEAAFARAMAARRAAWAGEYDAGTIAAVEAVVEGSLGEVFDPDGLAAAAFDPRGLHEAGARAAAAALDDPGHFSDAERRYADCLLTAGLRAAFEAGGLFERFAQRLALEQARRIAQMQAKLERIDEGIRNEVPRELLESLALRFEHANPDAPVGELGAFLKGKAGEWKDLRARLAALEAEDPRIADARAAAEAAIAGGDFDGADALLADAEALQQEQRTLVEVRRQAGLRRARAEALLLKGDADRAAAHFEAAAGFLVPFSPPEAGELRHAGAVRLYEEGLRLGGTGLLRAIELHRRNGSIWSRTAAPGHWARTQNNLALALGQQAARTEGLAGAALLAEAVAAYRAVLEVRTKEAGPLDWAMTQNNLGIALWNGAGRTEGPAGTGMLADAVTAYRGALQIYSRAAHPANWAVTQNNLGIALSEQAARTEGQAGARLLAEAVAAYRAALEVHTRTTHAGYWALTQNNLASALWEQAERTPGPAGIALLAEAVEAYRAALEVRTRATHPIDWAATQNNLGAALRTQATRSEGPAAAGLLAEAVAAYRAALEVRTRAAHPVDWAATQSNLAIALCSQAARAEGPEEAAELLAQAVAAHRAALEVRTRAASPVSWALTQNNLGSALFDQAARTDGPAGDALLEQSMAAYRAALEVRTREAHPVDWAMTQENLALALEAAGDRRGDRGAHARALAAFDAALGVFASGGLEANRAKCERNRAEVAAKLASAESGARP